MSNSACMCPTNKTAGVPPASKVIFSIRYIYTFFCQPPVRPHARIKLRFKTFKRSNILGLLGSKYTIKMKRKVR